MSDRTIVIRNIYVMLAYAVRAIKATGTDTIANERFDRLHDLLAEILVRGVGTQIKRGLHRDYSPRVEELTTVRGRIRIGGVAAHARARGRLVCEFDEYHIDTPHNQALKSVITLLIKHGEVDRARRVALRRALAYLEDVTPIAPTQIRWDALTYHRENASYRLLLGVCELIVRGLLPTDTSGQTKLATWISDDAMSSLYERFLRSYYSIHHPELSPSARNIAWDLDASSPQGEQLPRMRTDVTLRRGIRTLIIDAKYYNQTLQHSQWGKATVRSEHLYQILSYVTNEDRNHDGSVSGLLLYAKTDALAQPSLDVNIQGNRIGALTLDLGQPWEAVAAQLEGICLWIDG